MQAATFVMLLASTVIGQENGVPREDVRAKVTIKGVRPGLLAVVSEQGEEWLVKIDARPQDISYVAAAELNWLRPGMLVRFKNTFDSKGKPLALVDQLEVITLRPDTQLGLIPDSKLGGGGLFADTDEPQKKASAPDSASFTVAGKLRGLKNGTMLVAAGRVMVQSKLSDKAKVSVDISDYSLARDGDLAELTGWYYLGQKNRVFARSLKISSQSKLGAEDASKANLKKKKGVDKDEKDDVKKKLEDLFSLE
jgi:hypothetical protein